MPRKKSSHKVHLKRKLLEEWRGLPLPRRTKPAKSLSNEVGSALDSLGVGSSITESDIMSAWNEMMPKVISENTRPTAFQNGYIEISVLQPSILYTLDRQMKMDIIKKFQSVFGKTNLKGVNFRLG
ncbi:MAG: hypothetical protein CMO42_01105 [Verrucomicrobiales bacterium]|jgi:hypothetical protein|nr:hypothetical protein [Verrucomicrobiales bacterium]MEC9042362.1 DciA family protein [Verrucomicrobiota bacterium]